MQSEVSRISDYLRSLNQSPPYIGGLYTSSIGMWAANRECASTVQIILFVMHDTAAASFCDARHSARGQSKLV